ncbi:MAG: radical SAM protein [bacterium]
MFPTALMADENGTVTDVPELAAAGRSGSTIRPLDSSSLVPLPRGSTLYLLPGRLAVGYGAHGKAIRTTDGTAIAAFLPPGYTATALAAFDRQDCAPVLPLYCYCAVCWHRGRLHVPAVRVDKDPKHDPGSFDEAEVRRRVKHMLGKAPHNRLLRHHGLVCALRYHCPNAANLFLGRWEAPVAVTGTCNAACLGCISKQPRGTIKSPQERIGFTPTVAEIVQLAVPHLEHAPRAVISFGQGCEGEPLMKWKLIEDAIRAIRQETARGTIHLNTNGSRPLAVGRLADAGLDSIRISLNSARGPLYEAYYRCRDYSFADVEESFSVARKSGLRVSANYLTFPGVTDDRAEYSAFSKLLARFSPDMIQWRNLNIDPDLYMDTVERALPSHKANCLGIGCLITRIHAEFPAVRRGYFNQPVMRRRRG